MKDERRTLLPPEGSEEEWPLILRWSGKEYDVHVENSSLITDKVLNELKAELTADETVSGEFGVIDRGEGRINIIPSGYEPRHKRVAEVVIKLFANLKAT